MTNKQLYPLAFFVGGLILAIYLGNTFLTFVLQRPIEQVPNILKFIVHGASLGFIAVFAKKYFLK